MERDDEARGQSLAHETFDRGMRLCGGLARQFERACPSDVVEVLGAIDGNPDTDFVLFEKTYEPIVDERAVGLDAIRAESLEPEGPQLFEHMLGHEQWLAAEDREIRAGPVECGLHLGDVELGRDVASVSLRVLIAILALYIALDAQRSDFDAHDATLPDKHSARHFAGLTT